MAKLTLANSWNSGKYIELEGQYIFDCPGCGHSHVLYTNPNSSKHWEFNGDLDKPTASPSLLVTWPEGEDKKQRRCHFFIRNGKLEFCSDSDHELAGQTVEMFDI